MYPVIPLNLNKLRLRTIQHVFEHDKNLQPGKWVKVTSWDDPEARRKISAAPGHCAKAKKA